MKIEDLLNHYLQLEGIPLDKFEPMIREASAGVATQVLRAVSDLQLDPTQTLIHRKGHTDTEQETLQAEKAIKSIVSSGAIGLDGELMYQAGLIQDYFTGMVFYLHNYGSKYLPVGRNVGIEYLIDKIVAKTVFAKTTMARELYHLYADDIIFEGQNFGPICQDWSVDYIPIERVRKGGSGWDKARDLALKARPDIEENIDALLSIVFKWLIIGYSVAPIGLNQEAKTYLTDSGALQGKALTLERAEGDPLKITSELLLMALIGGSEGEEPTPTPEPEKKEEEKKETPGPEGTPEPEATPAPESEEEKKKEDKDDGQKPSDNGGSGPPDNSDNKKSSDPNPGGEAGQVFDLEAMARILSDEGVEGGSLDIRAMAKEIEQANIQGKGFTEWVDFIEWTIQIFSPIDRETTPRIVRNLLGMSLMDPEHRITLIINTPGGVMTDGYAIIDAMEYIPNPIRTIGMGQIMSMGLMIAMAGDERYIAEKAIVMAHELWGGLIGSLSEMESQMARVKNLEKIAIAHLIKYSKYTDQASVEENLWKPGIDANFTAKEAIKHGLFDKILTPDIKLVDLDTESAAGKGIQGKALIPGEEPKEISFVCSGCKHELIIEKGKAKIEATTEQAGTLEMKELSMEIIEMPCPKCEGKLERVSQPAAPAGEAAVEAITPPNPHWECEACKHTLPAKAQDFEGLVATLTESGMPETAMAAIMQSVKKTSIDCPKCQKGKLHYIEPQSREEALRGQVVEMRQDLEDMRAGVILKKPLQALLLKTLTTMTAAVEGIENITDYRHFHLEPQPPASQPGPTGKSPEATPAPESGPKKQPEANELVIPDVLKNIEFPFDIEDSETGETITVTEDNCKEIMLNLMKESGVKEAAGEVVSELAQEVIQKAIKYHTGKVD